MNLQLIELAIGLVFVYLLLSIFAMTVMEMISTFFRMRGEMLKSTIEKMLFDKSKNPEKINEFYEQPLILFLGDDVSTSSYLDQLLSKKYKKLPSYLKKEDFYAILLSFINDKQFSDSLEEIQKKIEQASFSENTKSHLLFLLKKSAGNITDFKQEIIHWFDECMERANTWYSRRVQYILLVLGFVIAFAVNGDTLRMIDKLNSDEKLRKELVESAAEYVKKNPEIKGRPKDSLSIPVKIEKEYNTLLSESHNLLGWEKAKPGQVKENDKSNVEDIFFRILGFLLTAFAISLGSNFWFDMLKKLLNIRTLGKPTQNP
ncbi:hypothetical protein [Chryseobacterium sp. MEBOG07]|uniref:hypothetical protein n=1 Tax=Chryseobacterium sp. MEBOG07 TaxID=2879939 RepID=UPI001F453914|nr:hypothetical protein [Chryseobacterium sp. MEBOG07]UKB80738.1 hypothetical protein LF886_07035 [Chryseobacterium sp. MEBOG07]